MDNSIWMWVVFASLVLIILALDLGVFNKNDHEIQVKESLYLSLFYILIALAFGLWICYSMGTERGIEYYTGYLIEKSLSLDNIFVISLIFTALNIPRIYQHRVLFWGILGVIVLRGIMIWVGSELVENYSWILYLFGLFLILTGFKMLFIAEKDNRIEDSKILRFLATHLPVTSELHGNKFFVHLNTKGGARAKLYVSPLFIALLMVECVDAIFAIDSVPAIFSITTDPYIVYTSNIFAILGLRALFFALAAVLHRFVYLKQSLALVLLFIGSKMFIADYFGWVKFPAGISLSITFGLIMAGILYSIYKTRT